MLLGAVAWRGVAGRYVNKHHHLPHVYYTWCGFGLLDELGSNDPAMREVLESESD